jgi:signal transduction histidine kinase
VIKTFVFTFLFAFVCNFGFAQTREAIDSLQHQLTNAKHDTSRINAQVALCLLYRVGNTDSSILYGQQALQGAQQINYLPGQIQALSFMCIVTEQQGNLPKSLELGFKALQLAEENHLESLAGPALDGIAEVYIILKDYPKAINYLRTYVLVIDAENDEGLAYAYFDMGVAFEGMNQLDSANFYEEKAIENFRKYNREEPLVYQTLGNVKLKSGKSGEALSYYEKSLQIALKNNERRASAYAYNKIAALYKSVNQPDSAIFYGVKGLQESQLIAQKKTILDAATLLSELYETSDTKESLQYLKIATAYKDSLFGAGNIQAVQTLVEHEEERQKEIEAAKLTYQNQLKQYTLIAGLVILLLIAFFLYRSSRKEKKAKNTLLNKNEVIEQTLNHLRSTQAQLIQSEKMASLGELTAGIAHEIQNPLNFVNNFSEVNTELIDELQTEIKSGNTEEAISISNDIKKNSEKINHHGIRAGDIVKGMLQHSRASTGVKEPTDINALADEYLRLSYHGLRAKDKNFNVEMKTEFDSSIGKINIIPQDIGRVLLNLYNNAFYACAERSRSAVNEQKSKNPISDTKEMTPFEKVSSLYEPTVSVTTKKSENNVIITVSDNGNGIPQKIKDKIFQPFFTTKPTGQGTGLGLSLSYDIIKAHGGEIKVESKEGEGTEFNISLPVF